MLLFQQASYRIRARYRIYAINYRKFRDMPSFPNHSWVEVTRSSANCISFYHGGVNEFDEGANSTGFPIGPTFYDGRLVPYGCWFSLAKGTGVFINTGWRMCRRAGDDQLCAPETRTGINATLPCLCDPSLPVSVRREALANETACTHAGNVAFGSAFSTQLGASAVMEAMIMAGYAAITPGNHDTLEAFPARIPLVSVNSSSKLVQKELERLIGGRGLSHVEHIDVHAMARLIIDESLCLRKQGVTMVVLLRHGGIAAFKKM
eukprot:gene29586-38708_t